MGQALYRKYRSRSLDEIVGQEHITTTLKNALKNGKISHAYLFTGPKGVGKTSIARILAFEINGLPYSDDSQKHMDIIEIDAASNRRIDEIRELRDKVNVAPTSAKYKVYIIDEVHMLTREAFNALLKTLEEPPEHAVFILATTEVHKLPETIVSRTQRFTFKPVSTKQAATHLKSLAKSEKITIDDESLELIAEHGGGSFRDSISLLDQLSGYGGDINVDSVRQMVGVPPETAVQDLLAHMRAHDVGQLVSGLQALYAQEYQPAQIAKRLSKLLRTSGPTSADDFHLLKQLIDVPSSYDPTVYLELILLEATLSGDESTVAPAPEQFTRPTPEVKSEAPTVAKQVSETPKPKKPTGNTDLWTQTLDKLKGEHNTLYGIARMAEAEHKDGTLTLTFAFPFHQRRCNEARNRERIEAVMKDIAGKHIELICVVGKVSNKKLPEAPKHKPKQNQKSDTLESITEVFGGGEVLE